MKLQREAEGYLELGLARRALDVLARLGDPTRLDGHSLYLWGEALRELERYEDALIPLGQAAEIEPENIHIWLAMGWCYKRIGRLDLAVESLEEALAADPDESLIHYNLACYWSLAGDKQRALGYLEQSLAIEPRYARLTGAEPDFDPIRDDPDFQAVVNGQPVGE
jgi:tetratricopeptide (TPR) repeat protein